MRFARNSAFNAAVGAGQRIQQRRRRRGRRQIVRRDLSTVVRRPGMFRNTGRINNKNDLRRMVVSTSGNIATAVVNTVSQMQVPTVRVESGTELICELQALESKLCQVDEVINPCDPGTLPGLTAIASQFQRFRTNALSVTYTPTAPTNTSGTVYMAFVPDPTYPAPQALSDIINLAGVVSSPVYGKGLTIDIAKSSLQQAYNIQNVQKPVDPEDQEPLIASGKLMVFLTGVEGNADDMVYGTVTITYSYTFSSKQLTQGANQLNGYVHFDVDAGTHLFYPLHYEDYKMITPTDLSNVYKVRVPGARHLVESVVESITGAGDQLLVAEYSQNGTDFTPVAATRSHKATNRRIQKFFMPPAKFWRFTEVPQHDDADFEAFFTTLPAEGPNFGHEIDY